MSVLTDLIADIRKLVDDPVVSAKYSDTELLRLVRTSWDEVMREITATASNKVRVRYDITIVADQREYVLPPTVDKLVAFEKRNADGDFQWEMIPRDLFHPAGPGFTIEGPRLYLDPVWKEGETLTVVYVPNGEVPPHDGTGLLIVGTTSGTSLTGVTQLVLDDSPSTGSLDGRVNAYGGYVLRVLTKSDTNWGQSTGHTTAPIVQERVITSSGVYATDKSKFVVTFAPTLDPLPGWTAGSPPTLTGSPAGQVTYEIVPTWMALANKCIGFHVARTIAGTQGDNGRLQTMDVLYKSSLRSLKLGATNASARMPRTFPRRQRSYIP